MGGWNQCSATGIEAAAVDLEVGNSDPAVVRSGAAVIGRGGGGGWRWMGRGFEAAAGIGGYETDREY